MTVPEELLPELLWWQDHLLTHSNTIRQDVYYIEMFPSIWDFKRQGRLPFYYFPYTRALVNTWGRWIKQALEAAGIDTNIYTTYSTRHGNTSAAACRGPVLDTIRQAAGWTSRPKTFARFYLWLLVSDTTFSTSILQSTISQILYTLISFFCICIHTFQFI